VDWIANAVPWTIAFLSLVFVALTYLRNGRKDTKNEIVEENVRFDSLKEGLIKANMKLDQVCATTNETRADIKSLSRDLGSLDIRVSVLERDLKTAFVRIDELKGVNYHE
jgi:hypothetical protein